MAASAYPSVRALPGANPLASREQDVLTQLTAELPQGFHVYHGVHWSRLEAGLTAIGRLQFLVLTPKGLLIAVLMKTGLLKFEGGRLFKQLGDSRSDLFNQLLEQSEYLAGKFQAAHGQSIHVEGLFFCPDFQVPVASGLAVEASRVLDSKRRDDLAQAIIQLEVACTEHKGAAFNKLVQQFLNNTLELVPEVGALSHAADKLITRLTQGLDDWVSRMDFEPFRLRVLATAGSGKSLLAWRELQRAHASKLRALYVCYNRPLAAHIGRQLDQESWLGVQALNFHALCDRLLRDAGHEVDYSNPQVFETLPARVAQLPEDRRWVFDTIVVDEGQDFDPEWLPVLQRLAHPRTRWVWLEDPSQNLYRKPAVALPAWVTVRSPMNYRNPRQVVELLLGLQASFDFEGSAAPELIPACPLEGLPTEVYGYGDTADLMLQTGRAITHCLKKGFGREQIVVLSVKGLEKSHVLKQAAAGPHALRHFTGRYDSHGQQLFTEGSVLAETVYRFKGQSASAVIVTEIDFEKLDLQAYRKLFVAISRVGLQLVLVGSHACLAGMGLEASEGHD